MKICSKSKTDWENSASQKVSAENIASFIKGLSAETDITVTGKWTDEIQKDVYDALCELDSKGLKDVVTLRLPLGLEFFNPLIDTDDEDMICLSDAESLKEMWLSPTLLGSLDSSFDMIFSENENAEKYVMPSYMKDILDTVDNPNFKYYEAETPKLAAGNYEIMLGTKNTPDGIEYAIYDNTALHEAAMEEDIELEEAVHYVDSIAGYTCINENDFFIMIEHKDDDGNEQFKLELEVEGYFAREISDYEGCYVAAYDMNSRNVYYIKQCAEIYNRNAEIFETNHSVQKSVGIVEFSCAKAKFEGGFDIFELGFAGASFYGGEAGVTGLNYENEEILRGEMTRVKWDEFENDG